MYLILLDEGTLTHIGYGQGTCMYATAWGYRAGDCRPFRRLLLVSSLLVSSPLVSYRFLAALPAAHRPSDMPLQISCIIAALDSCLTP